MQLCSSGGLFQRQKTAKYFPAFQQMAFGSETMQST